MGQNIISIGQSPNRMLFDPTDTPDNVRPIQNNFWIIQNLNPVILAHLHITHCLNGPEFYFILKYPELAYIQHN